MSNIDKPDNFELNLFNPLWVYDLFPPVQCSWNRMPYAGDNFETESSFNKNEQQPEQSESQEDRDPSDIDNTDDDSIDDVDDDTSNSDDDIEGEDKNRNDEDGVDEEENEEEFDETDDEPLGEDDDENGEQTSNSNEPTNNKNEPDNKRDRDSLSNTLHDPNPAERNEYNLEDPKPTEKPPIPSLTITKNPDGSVDYHREFNSWDEFVTCAADENLYAWKHNRESHEAEQNTAGAAASFDEAVEMARFRGWPEGQKLLSDLMSNIYTKPEIFEVWNFDVAGMFPVVPAYLSGDPACMMIEPDINLRAQHPIIRIDYNNYVAWTVKPWDMMVRGAAILSLANNLEDHGFQTELRIIGNCYDYLGSKYDPNTKCMFRYSIIFKKPSEFIDIDRAAFAFAHPASMRRLGFALLEQHAELEPGFGGNYGYITAEPNDPEAGTIGNIFVPGSSGYETETSAKSAVLEAASNTTSALQAA